MLGFRGVGRRQDKKNMEGAMVAGRQPGVVQWQETPGSGCLGA